MPSYAHPLSYLNDGSLDPGTYNIQMENKEFGPMFPQNIT